MTLQGHQIGTQDGVATYYLQAVGRAHDGTAK
jgi:hypothetical protein